MQIVIVDNRTLQLSQLFEGQSEVINRHFSARDPNARYSQAMKNHKWDGYVRKFNTYQQTLSKAFLGDLINFCNEQKIPYDIVDKRPKSKYPRPSVGSFDNSLIEGITLRPHQMRSLDSVCEVADYEKNLISEYGIHKHKTGAGKTEMLCGVVKLFRCPTVIITEQVVVLDQIVERLKLRNVVHNNDIGMFCSGLTPTNNVVIVGSTASIQNPIKPKLNKIEVKSETVIKEFDRMFVEEPDALKVIIGQQAYSAIVTANATGNKDLISTALERPLMLISLVLKKKYFEAALKGYHTLIEKTTIIQEMIKKCELLLVDECDKGSSDLYEILYKDLFKGRYVYGYSGTPFDPDAPIQNLTVSERFGSIISESSRAELEAIGAIQPVSYYMIQHGKMAKDAKDAFDVAERAEITENIEFHNRVKQIVDSFPNDGTLILVDTLEIEHLGLALEKLIPGSVFIYNKTPKAKRDKAIKDFENRIIKVLIGSKIVKRGLDLRGGCENLIICGGGKRSSNFDQMIGRAVRLTKRGFSRVWDFYFTGNYYLINHSRKRLKYIVAMEYKTTVLINKKQIDGPVFIRNRYKAV